MKYCIVTIVENDGKPYSVKIFDTHDEAKFYMSFRMALTPYPIKCFMLTYDLKAKVFLNPEEFQLKFKV